MEVQSICEELEQSKLYQNILYGKFIVNKIYVCLILKRKSKNKQMESLCCMNTQV